MEILGWIAQNAFDLISIVGVIGGLVFTAASFHSEAKTRRVANLIALTQNHRELWRDFYRGPELLRVLDSDANFHTLPISPAEETFVKLMIQHLASFYGAMKCDLTIKPDGVRRDVRDFFSLPIPKAVWNKYKKYQDEDFSEFVVSCLG